MAQFSAKRVQIDKANFTILIVMSVACFLTIFSLIASRALLQQRSYQAGVIEKKETAREQLKQNIVARDQLVDQYKIFVGNQQNLIGGSSSGTGDKDGDNAKLVLDALPSQLLLKYLLRLPQRGIVHSYKTSYHSLSVQYGR